MEVTLNQNGWHAKLHKWVTGKNPTYRSLCPYFWKTIFFLAISPLVLAMKLYTNSVESIISYSERRIEKKSKLKFETAYKQSWFKRNKELILKIGKWTCKFFIITYFSLVAIFISIGAVKYIMDHGFEKFAIIIVIIIGFVISLTALVLGILYLSSLFFKSDTWDSIKGMAYSFKNKVCPAINWKE
jgi:hypothetical protein